MNVAPLTAATVGTTTTGAAAGMSVVDEAHAPASVRNGSAAVKQSYATAQGFEAMLLQQLSQSLVQSSGLSGEGAEGSGEEGSPEGGGEASSTMLSSLLPQTLTEGVMHEGGLGLAPQLMGTLAPAKAATTSAAATGGVSPTATAGVSPAASDGVGADTGGVAP
jgi:hypothetical protein